MFIDKSEAQKIKLTPERIISIVKSHGYFDASLRHRDHWLRKRCLRMCRAGQLIYVGIVHGAKRYLIELPKTKEDIENLMPEWGIKRHKLMHLFRDDIDSQIQTDDSIEIQISDEDC